MDSIANEPGVLPTASTPLSPASPESPHDRSFPKRKIRTESSPAVSARKQHRHENSQGLQSIPEDSSDHEGEETFEALQTLQYTKPNSPGVNDLKQERKRSQGENIDPIDEVEDEDTQLDDEQGEDDDAEKDIEQILANFSSLPLEKILEFPQFLATLNLAHVRRCAECAIYRRNFELKRAKERKIDIEKTSGAIKPKRRYAMRLKPDEVKLTKCTLATADYILSLWQNQQGTCGSCKNVLTKTKFHLKLVDSTKCPSPTNFLSLLCPICHALWQCVLYDEARYDTYRELLFGHRPRNPFSYSVSCPVVVTKKKTHRLNRVGESTYLPSKCKDIKKYQDVWEAQGGLACYHISQDEFDQFDLETRNLFIAKTKHCLPHYDTNVRRKRYWNFQSKLVFKIPLYRDANHLLTPMPEYFEKKFYTLIPVLFVRIQGMVGKQNWLKWLIRNVELAPPPTESVEKCFFTPSEGLKHFRKVALIQEKIQVKEQKVTDSQILDKWTEQHNEIEELQKILASKTQEHNSLFPQVLNRMLNAHEREESKVISQKHGTAWHVKYENGPYVPITKHQVHLTALKVLTKRSQPDAAMYAQEIADEIFANRKRRKPIYKLESG